jgi:hypothetical protein
MKVQSAMRISQLLRFIFTFFTLVLMGACVSVNLGKSESQRSREAKWTSPKAPFVELKSIHLDKTWRNNKNGNTISYLSDCHNPADPSLENIFKGITSEIEEVTVVQSDRVDYNSREALHTTVEGAVDGVPTRFELMIFKKNDCTYILTYATTAKAFAENQRDFNSFVREFNVP